jgi:Tfp pilus assembly protein PilP
MKLTTGILVLGMAVGAAWGQNPDVIENTKNTVNNVEKKKAMDENAAMATTPAPQAAAPARSTSASASKTKAAPAPHVTAVPKTVAMTATSQSKTKTKAVATKKTSQPKPSQPKQKIAVADSKKPAEPKKEDSKKINLTGQRDPFVSPVVNRSMLGSGCNTGGKRCLAIDQVNLKGVVKSEAGMIAVVVNALDKAYFLRENDPVFNGYVVKITGDSIIFKETIQDKLGKSFTREVTKKITTPAV